MVDFSKAATREDLEAARVRQAARMKGDAAVDRGRVDPSQTRGESAEVAPKAATAEPESRRKVDDEVSARARLDRVRRMYAEIDSQATAAEKDSDNRTFTGPN